MIAYSCKGCRQPLVAEDAQSGRRVTCPSCSDSVTVPDHSEQDVLLLRGAAETSTVVPVCREVAAQRLDAGELKRNHPTWLDGQWVGLDEALAAPRPPGPPGVAGTPAEPDAELHEVFGPLKPIDLSGGPPEPAEQSVRRGAGGRLGSAILILVVLVAGGVACHRLKLLRHLRLPAGLAWPALGSGGFTGADVGSPGIKGNKTGNASSMTLTAAGSDIWGTADECFFAHRKASGNLTLTVQVDSLTETHEWSKAGIMLRDDLTGNGRAVSLVVTPRNGAALQVRDAPGAESRSTVRGGGSIKAPYWLRLERAGNAFRGSASQDGATWETLGEYEVPLNPDVLAGLCLTSHEVGKSATARFSSFALTGSAAAAAAGPGSVPPRQWPGQ